MILILFLSLLVYDIRQPSDDPSPPTYFMEYLNTPKIQGALGVNLNYTNFSNYDLFDAFANSGDYAYPFFKSDLESLLEKNVSITLCKPFFDRTRGILMQSLTISSPWRC